MSPTERAPARPSALVLIGLVCGPFVSMVDSNAVNVAVPTIARELDASLAAVGWTVSAYLLGIAAALPATAWLARRYGTRRTYLAALVAFGLASAACAAAPGIEALIGLRALQGVASAPLIPLALSLLFGGGGKMRPPVMAGMFFFLAPALGPTIGGLITASTGWRPIFLINVPLVAIGLLGARKLAPDPPTTDRSPLDLRGLAMLAAGATLATYGASVITSDGWDALDGWPCCLAGLILLAGYLAHERRTAHPAVSLRLLADRSSRVAVAVCVVASVVLFAVLFLIPIFTLQVQGHSALVAGLVLFPQGIAMGLCSGLGEKLIAAVGLRTTVVSGMAVLTATTALLLTVSAQTPPWLIALLLTGRGAALGLTLQPLITGMLTRQSTADVTDVSTLFNVVQRVGGSLGIAGVAAFYQARAAGVTAFHDTVWLLVAVALAGALLAALLPNRTSSSDDGWKATPEETALEVKP